MLLDRQSLDDAQVLVLRGPVGGSDAPQLATAVDDALGRSARGVVIDLTAAETIDLDAWRALSAAALAAGPWPRPALRVCGRSAAVGGLEPSLVVHRDRHDALDHLDDRSPDQLEVVVGHDLGAPAQARAAAGRWAAEHGLGAVADDLLLVVSELVTNAVRYGRPPVLLSLAADENAVTVGVLDSGTSLPVARDAAPVHENGRGLLLLSRLSVQHGVRPQPPGKVVWARLERT